MVQYLAEVRLFFFFFTFSNRVHRLRQDKLISQHPITHIRTEEGAGDRLGVLAEKGPFVQLELTFFNSWLVIIFNESFFEWTWLRTIAILQGINRSELLQQIQVCLLTFQVAFFRELYDIFVELFAPHFREWRLSTSMKFLGIGFFSHFVHFL